MKIKITKLSLLAASLIPSLICLTSSPERPKPKPVAPTESAYEAAAADVATIDGIIVATYDVISGAAGEARDWDRMRSLFRPDVARLMSVGQANDEVVLRSFSPDEYIEGASAFFAKEAFYERELSRKTEEFGHIAHVFSTYESVHELDGEPFDRGINSFQLMWDKERWWVVTIYWDRESEKSPIPKRYLE